MRSPSVKPSAYPPVPFHLIRFLISLSSLVVGVILAVFTYHLHADGYKLPYSFLVVSNITIHTKQSSLPNKINTNKNPPTALRLIRPLPPQHNPNLSNPLQLRPINKTLYIPQHPPNNPLGPIPGSVKLEPGKHNNNIMHNNLLGQLDRHRRLPKLQSPLHIHHHRPGQLRRRSLAGCDRASASDSSRCIRSHGITPGA